jgi:hypothetical protein
VEDIDVPVAEAERREKYERELERRWPDLYAERQKSKEKLEKYHHWWCAGVYRKLSTLIRCSSNIEAFVRANMPGVDPEPIRAATTELMHAAEQAFEEGPPLRNPRRLHDAIWALPVSMVFKSIRYYLAEHRGGRARPSRNVEAAGRMTPRTELPHRRGRSAGAGTNGSSHGAGAPPPDPIDRAVQALVKSPESVRLIRYLADKPGRTAHLDDIAVELDRTPRQSAQRRRSTIRQRFNRARESLEKAGGPVRLFIDRGRVSLVVEVPRARDVTRM